MIITLQMVGAFFGSFIVGQLGMNLVYNVFNAGQSKIEISASLGIALGTVTFDTKGVAV